MKTGDRYTVYDYREKREYLVARMKRLRELNTPRWMLRHEQMFLWAHRRHLNLGYFCAVSQVPGFEEVEQKFLSRHRYGGIN